MERNNRLIQLLLVALLVFSFSACVQDENKEEVNQGSNDTTTQTTSNTVSTSVSTTKVSSTSIVTTTTTKISTTKNTTTTTNEVVQGSTLNPVMSQYILDLLQEQDSFYLYLGLTTCPHCQAYQPIIEDTLNGMSDVKFFSIMLDMDKSEAKKDLVRLLELEYIPMTIQVVNGEIIDSYVGEMTKEELISFMK